MRKALRRMSTLHNIAVCMLVSTISQHVEGQIEKSYKYESNDYHSMKVHALEAHNQLSLKG